MNDRRYHDEHAPQPPSYREVPKEDVAALDFSQIELRAIAKSVKSTTPDGLSVFDCRDKDISGLVVSASEHNRSVADFRTTLIDIRTLIDAAYRVDTPAALINSLGEIGRLVDKALKS